MHPPIPLPVCFCLSIDAWQASSITMCVQECSSRRRRKITAGLEGRGLCSWYSCSSIPPRQMPRVYECTGETSECVCVPEHSEREREWGRGTKNETVWEHATISCSNVKQWKRDRERERASSWPSCFKMSSAFVYIEENLLLRSGKLRKRERLSIFVSCSSLFFFLRGSFLSHPPFVALCPLPTPSVFLFSPSRRPLFNFRSLSHDARSISLSFSLFLRSFAFVLLEREREREGIRASTFRQFIFCSELVRSQSGFLWSRASGNAVATRTAILR